MQVENTIQTCKDGNIALVAMTIPTWSKSQKNLEERQVSRVGIQQNLQLLFPNYNPKNNWYLVT